MKEHRIFILDNNVKYYKTDSFWSLSEDPHYAKTHLCPGYIPENLLKNLKTILNQIMDWQNENHKLPYINALIGYENEINESVITNQIIFVDDKFKIVVSRNRKLERILK